MISDDSGWCRMWLLSSLLWWKHAAAALDETKEDLQHAQRLRDALVPRPPFSGARRSAKASRPAVPMCTALSFVDALAAPANADANAGVDALSPSLGAPPLPRGLHGNHTGSGSWIGCFAAPAVTHPTGVVFLLSLALVLALVLMLLVLVCHFRRLHCPSACVAPCEATKPLHYTSRELFLACRVQVRFPDGRVLLARPDVDDGDSEFSSGSDTDSEWGSSQTSGSDTDFDFSVASSLTDELDSSHPPACDFPAFCFHLDQSQSSATVPTSTVLRAIGTIMGPTGVQAVLAHWDRFPGDEIITRFWQSRDPVALEFRSTQC